MGRCHTYTDTCRGARCGGALCGEDTSRRDTFRENVDGIRVEGLHVGGEDGGYTMCRKVGRRVIYEYEGRVEGKQNTHITCSQIHTIQHTIHT